MKTYRLVLANGKTAYIRIDSDFEIEGCVDVDDPEEKKHLSLEDMAKIENSPIIKPEHV